MTKMRSGHFLEKKHNIIINVAVGGAFIADKNSLNFAEEAQMQVDWVKVYKK